MNWSILLTFAIVLGVYFVGLIVFVIIKAIRNKKKFEKERSKDEKVEVSNN